ncbi:MAG TPA: Crp/Fnr family transcriptional regulator [Sphingomonas sp.]|jgi:CRP-like cAMP-binding protein|uniref:Crp/Fnr family transcriptional regulator n=1 Tax=Sphingomonas sp. TaxID=28214 RepID=UPI002ED9A821
MADLSTRSTDRSMIERHLAKLRARDEVSLDEEAAIRAAIAEYRDYPADYRFIRARAELDHSTLIIEGWACRYKDVRSGQRQITELHVAGDFADLHSFTLKHLDHDVMTLTPTRVAIVPHDALRTITERFPHLTRLYWFNTNLDAAIHREWELSLGRRTALARLANLICELGVRLGIVGLTDEDGFDLPLTQTDLADCLGLTNIHVNRMLKELREQGMVEVQAGRVTIFDTAKLRHVAEFDPTYLYLDRRSR